MEITQVDKFKFICFTDAGRLLMEKIAGCLLKEVEDTDLQNLFIKETDSLKEWTSKVFISGNVLIFIGAMGIAVRAIAPYIKDKCSDPAVIVIDEKGYFVVPVLSGHIGGAVDYAKKIAGIIGGIPVITTATDVEELFAVDVFAKEKGMFISDMKKAKEFSAKILRQRTATYYVEEHFSKFLDLGKMPEELIQITDVDGKPDLIISPAKISGDVLQLIPRCIVIGIGCRKRTAAKKLYDFCEQCLDEAEFDIHSVKAVASIDIKADEPGIIELAGKLDAEFVTYSSETLMKQKGDFSSSDFVKAVTGADNICERAVMAYGCEKLLIKKRAQDGMTFSAGIIKL